ncbi:MAG: tetratricopeptide repeat protein [Myxococcales bacterium]
MIEFSPDAERACDQLRGIMPRPGAETRVFRRIANRPQGRQLWALRIAVVPIVLVMAGSLAYGFVGIAKQVLVGRHEDNRESQGAEPLNHARSKRKFTRGQQPWTPPLDSSQPPVRDAEKPPVLNESGSESQWVVSVGLPATKPGTTPDHPRPQGQVPSTSNTVSTSDNPRSQGLAPSTPHDHMSPAPSAASASPLVREKPRAASNASQLDLEVADYQAALAFSHQDPQAALNRLRVHRRKWPTSALLHEVDLRIVQILSAQGQKSEAQAEARKFLERHPDSARLPEMRRLAGQATSDE